MNERPADRLAIAVAQLNPVVGDVSGNLAVARKARATAAARWRRHYRVFRTVHRRLSAGRSGAQAGVPVRLPRRHRDARARDRRRRPGGADRNALGRGGKLYNAYALLAGGRIAAIRFKVNLPNYGVFDEKRVFAPGPVPGPVNFRGVRLGLPICEDIWTDWGDYENVVECLAETGAEILVVPNGSPYWRDKAEVRLNVSVARVTEAGLPLLYVNQVGGQDELVFDGASFALNADRSIAFQLPAFREAVVTTHWSRNGSTWRCASGPIAPAAENRSGGLHRLHAWFARLCRQERLQGRRARPLRRRRFSVLRGAWRLTRSAPIACAA